MYYCYDKLYKSREFMCSSASTPEKTNAEKRFVPCRGCLADCIYIVKCEGKPWRMTESTILEAFTALHQTR